MKIYSVYSIKGGVGKTAAAVNLAYAAAAEGARTLVWDLDPQGASSFYFRVQPKIEGGSRRLLKKSAALAKAIKATDYPRLDLLPADFSYRKLDLALDRWNKPHKRLARLLAPLESEYDVVFLDCAPSISVVSEAILRNTSVLLIPTIPTVLSLRTLARLLKHLRTIDDGPPTVLPFFSMVDRRKALHRRVCGWAEEYGMRFLEQGVPYSSVVEQMGLRRSPVEVYAPRSEPARAFRALWAEIDDRLSQSRIPLGKTTRRVRSLLSELDAPSTGPVWPAGTNSNSAAGQEDTHSIESPRAPKSGTSGRRSRPPGASSGRSTPPGRPSPPPSR